MKIRKIAIVGSGLIGRSWALLIARSVYPVTMFDVNQEALVNVEKFVSEGFESLCQKELISTEEINQAINHINYTTDLKEALREADYVIEAVPENIDLKQNLYIKMEEMAGPDTIFASSTSSFPISLITRKMHTPERCIVAHPFNPPHLIPVVEVVPGPQTTTEVTNLTIEFLKEIGKVPVLCRKETRGFILNRLQNALLKECITLVDQGVASVTDVDAAVSAGIGMRWALMGPFEVFDLASDSGLKGFFEHFAPVLEHKWQQKGIEKLTPEIKSTIIEQFDSLNRPDRKERIKYRDDSLIELLKIKKMI